MSRRRTEAPPQNNLPLSMKLDIYQVDAFTDTVFSGNPAAVIPLKDWPDDKTLLNIAAENNLSETAFFVPGNNHYHLRWFTPTVEVDLCGHATLASAFVLFEKLGHKGKKITFKSRSGLLNVYKTAQGYKMHLPRWRYERIDVPEKLTEALGAAPDELYSGPDWVAVYSDSSLIRKITPDMNKLSAFKDMPAIVITARGTGNIDFISRFFGPAVGVPEDPVTGSAHCILAPFWGEKLDKTVLRARQVSRRGGDLLCEIKDEQVEITGQAVLYMYGHIRI